MSKKLSPTEKLILEELVKGSSNKEIGRALGISDATVKVHLKMMYAKMGIHNRLKLVVSVLNQRHEDDKYELKSNLETLRARIA